MKLKNLGSLITVEQNGQEYCLGYLFNFSGHGVFSPDGKVEVTPEQATIHNALLSQGEIKGLDENCQIGQKGTFYYIGGKVQTFIGTVIAEGSNVVVSSGKMIKFFRQGKTYRGRLQKDADCFNFVRIS